jgi:cell division protein FtsW
MVLKTLHHPKRRFDILLLITTVILALSGILMIYEASNVQGHVLFSDKYHFVREQTVSFFIGFLAMMIASFIPYKKYYQMAFPLLLFTVFLLFIVFIPGIGITTYGASRWLNLGFIKFQPSELTKIISILYLSSWLAFKEKGRFLAFFMLFAFIVGLVMLQPDMGTATIITMIFISLYFLSGSPLWHFAIIIPLIIGTGLSLAIFSPYRFARLTSFLNPNLDPLGASYHIRQILISLGSGGLFGMGLGASRQKYQYLPAAMTDSIFAIIAEEFGFIGSVVLVAVFIYFIRRLFNIALNAADKQGFLLACGILALFSFQILINLGAMTALLPLTGVPLPFFSYGGSSLVIVMVAVGIALNISKTQITKKH